MIPSLEMAIIVIHCIKGEPAVKVQRMLDVPGEDYKHSDHFTKQPLQAAVEYTPFKPQKEAKPEKKDETTGEITQDKQEGYDAEPAIMPIRHQPEVLENQCLKFYLLSLDSKRVNSTEADKFLATLKTQKPKQTCSNYLDEFVINYENYSHLKWSTEELEGIKYQPADQY